MNPIHFDTWVVLETEDVPQSISSESVTRRAKQVRTQHVTFVLMFYPTDQSRGGLKQTIVFSLTVHSGGLSSKTVNRAGYRSSATST